MAVAAAVSGLIGALVFSFARELGTSDKAQNHDDCDGCTRQAICTRAHATGSLFSNDPELIDLYHEVRLPLTAMMVTFAMAVFLERIPMTMGRTQLVMNVGLLGSWAGQVITRTPRTEPVHCACLGVSRR